MSFTLPGPPRNCISLTFLLKALALLIGCLNRQKHILHY